MIYFQKDVLSSPEHEDYQDTKQLIQVYLYARAPTCTFLTLTHTHSLAHLHTHKFPTPPNRAHTTPTPSPRSCLYPRGKITCGAPHWITLTQHSFSIGSLARALCIGAASQINGLFGCEPGRVGSGSCPSGEEHAYRHVVSLNDSTIVVSGRVFGESAPSSQRRNSFRGVQSAHTGMLGGHGRVYAAFTSTCCSCRSLIAKDTPIRFDVAAAKFVHECCVHVHQTSAPPTRHTVVGDSPTLPAVIKPATLQGYITEWDRYEALATRLGYVAIPGRDRPWDMQLLWAYMSFTEWDRYEALATRLGYVAIPGRDRPWDMQLLWTYMSFRERTCKPHTVTAGLSALAYFGARFNHLLPTSRHDSDSLTYHKLTLLNQKLTLDYNKRCGGVRYGPSQCTPLGQRTVSLLLSAFAIKDRQSFQRSSHRNRHHIVLTVMQHSAAMRFGHFPAKGYTTQCFQIDECVDDIVLVTDWHRYAGRRRYRLYFPSVPEEACRWYSIHDKKGEVLVHLSAAVILCWHLNHLNTAPGIRPGTQCHRVPR